MSEKELFREVLKYFEDYYKLEIKAPYEDGYIIIYHNGKDIGSFNYDGHNLLFNLNELTNILNYELG